MSLTSPSRSVCVTLCVCLSHILNLHTHTLFLVVSVTVPLSAWLYVCAPPPPPPPEHCCFLSASVSSPTSFADWFAPPSSILQPLPLSSRGAPLFLTSFPLLDASLSGTLPPNSAGTGYVIEGTCLLEIVPLSPRPPVKFAKLWSIT